MSDDNTPETPKRPAPKRQPRRRTTPAKAATPKRQRAKKADTVEAPVASAATETPLAKPAPPRRRKATSTAGAGKTVKGKSAATNASTDVEAPAKPKRTRAKQIKAPVPETPAATAPTPLAEVGGSTESMPPDEVLVSSDAPAAAAQDHADTLGLAWGESPVDLPGAARDEGSGLRWATGILLIASPLLLLFNSHAIDNWARQLPVNGWTGPVIDVATQWHARMQRIGLAAPIDAGRAGWKRVKGEAD